MSIIETLTEGVVNRNLQQEGAALLNKWTQTGLLEGLNESQKQNMAVLLENQAKSLLKESNTMAGGNIEGFAAVAFPIVRRVFAGLIANDLVSVQPMSLPSGLIFFLDFTFGTKLGEQDMTDRLGNTQGESIYGTDKVGSGVVDGVNLVGSTNKDDFSGPSRGGAVGYAYASATGSLSLTSNVTFTSFGLDDITNDEAKKIVYDPELLGLSGSGTNRGVLLAEITKANLESAATSALTNSELDFDNLYSFQAVLSGNGSSTSFSGSMVPVRRLTQVYDNAGTKTVRFVFMGKDAGDSTGPSADTEISGAMSATNINSSNETFTLTAPITDGLTRGGALGSIEGGATWALEGKAEIPEIDIKVDSIAITAQSKKLKAKWTPELGQDLNAYHNIDAEVELTSILSEQIALEIDREILADLVNGATAATYYWSRSPGLFLNRETGAEIGANTAAPDFTGTVSEWYETLIETINDVSAQIHRKTLRGGATHIVCSPEVANILEFTAGFRANVTADADKGDIGAVKVGSLNRKFDVIVDPYFPRNVVLVARIGSSFLESGYVYAPYVPLQTTPTIFGPEDFVPRKGVMTRYAKKMVRPDMYGLVVVRGLTGESGS
jgi:hypothetical protein